MSRLMLVEDDLSLGQTLTERLQKEGHTVSWMSTMTMAEEAFHNAQYDLLIVDVGLPDGSGFDFAQRVVRRKSVPLMFVTAQSAAADRLLGYELGAEEYIPKPFHLKEFLMRVRHVLKNHAPQDFYQFSEVKIDLAALQIERVGQLAVKLSAREAALIRILLQRSPKAVSRDEILDSVWGSDRFPSNRTIDNFVLRLRQALGPQVGSRIRTVRGLGYQWLDEKELS
jgi:two-component system phosphate regulon response regulator PhoB